ncbi:unnamed protein product [Anisakis simplex]|uniref:Peroxin-19 n=1 Tax=Anisakis simplex TaxID=6269 RepID=A0A0M3JCT4_ANISI|nr:unnamed protein product [Anisakis simplex]
MSSPPSSSKAGHATSSSSQKDDTAADSELSALLDSALDDFGRLKNTDDEIDSIMENMDQEAAQKAASHFDSLLKNLTLNTAANQQNAEATTNNPAMSSSSSTPQTPMTEEERRAAENFQKMLKTLVEAEEKAINETRTNPEAQPSEAEAAEASAFLEQLKVITISLMENYILLVSSSRHIGFI